jgi:hypothetical protein
MGMASLTQCEVIKAKDEKPPVKQVNMPFLKARRYHENIPQKAK